MDQEKYKKILLDKFFSKSLSKAERHELEKLALDDPFLFEALQGFTEVEGDHGADLKRIKSKKLEISEEKKKRSLVPYGIAASMIILLGISVWTLGPKSNQAANKTFAEAENQSNVKAEEIMETVATNGVVAEVESSNEDKDTEMIQEIVSKTKRAVPNSTEKSFDRPMAQAKEQSGRLQAPQKKSSIDQNSIPVEENSDPMIVASAPAPIGGVDQIVAEAEGDYETEDAEVMDEVIVEELAQKSVSKNKTEARKEMFANDGVAIDGVAVKQSFNQYFKESLEASFTKKELRQLRKDVVVEFDIIDAAVANFKTTPDQDSQMKVRLLELVKQGLQFLPNNQTDYKLDLRSL